jgi:hypothetical protein
MSATRRVERAILTALIENLSAAGFKPAAVWTEETYQLADGEEWSARHSNREIRKPMTTDEVLKVFDDFDMLTPTVHFTHQHLLSWGNRGVMVVNGNGEDFISDWHCGDKAFDAIIETVADAAQNGVLSLFVVPADIEEALLKAQS